MADSNIIIKITSEAQLDDAQLQLRELTDRGRELEAEFKKLKKAEEDDVKAVKARIAVGKENESELQATIKYNKELQKVKLSEINANKQSIKTLKDQVGSYNKLQGVGGRMITQLRAMQEQLMMMEDAGEFGTKAFVELSIAAAKLSDQIGDTRQRISTLASDTLTLDTIMGASDGLTGVFYIATSAAEVFGEDLEGLQKAFYKVQAAMSVVNGVQQVANALNKDSVLMIVAQNAASKLKEKSLQRNAALQAATNIQETAGVAADGAKTASTGILTKAQMSLNAAIAANPLAWLIGIIVAAIAAVAALGVGIYKLVHAFSSAGKAQDEYKDASKELEKIQAANSVGAAKRAYERQQQTKAISESEEKALNDAKKRNASEIELAQIRLKYAKQNANETKKYAEDEIKRNKTEVDLLKRMVDAKTKEVNAYKDGSKKKNKAQEELAEVEQQYYEILQKTTDLENERNDALREAAQAEQELAETRKQMRLEVQQANIELMKEGASKEMAQIKFNYQEQLKSIQGNSAEEISLRKALLAKQAKEIDQVRKKYALQAQQTALQEQKNLLEAMAQSSGSEADYAKEIELTKQIAQSEAQAKIDALDKANMADADYAAQKVAIELELAQTLKAIDDKEFARREENAKRISEIDVRQAEAMTKALNGSESVQEQKAIWDNYYSARKAQIQDASNFEIEAINNSTDTEEVKASKILQINTQLNSDLYALKQEQAQRNIDIDSKYLADLQIAANRAENAVSAAQTGEDKLTALRANLDAQKALYQAQGRQLKSQYEAGLISYQEYKEQEFEIAKSIADAEVEYQQNSLQAVADTFQTTLGYMQQLSDMAFEALNIGVQSELDNLEKTYTTDREEAKKNNDLKYISEKEYEKKKAALEMKQAKYAKAQALTNIAIQTALSIITTLAQLGATPWGIAASVIAGTMGAAQLAIAAAKPLAQYERGRNGGKGEYAIVGEKGAELMYIPSGASIVPHNKLTDQEAWASYGVPKLTIPELPHASNETINTTQENTQYSVRIDYDKLGEAVARNIPHMQPVTVNVDRNGVYVSDSSGLHSHLNTKYNGKWN
ncbi:MAG: hypothetical protein NC229_08530 [Bacteroides sp.]|nr:hypothetical protein [Bacteroidales bacterium]MCM1068710.1 hypothetical protein [Prevotella sp.]MCM1354690.1 hypothetical protein [Bacteroides sp.]MCM1403762.1 hypothetical protein [Bacteroides sp.]MCM1443520.1 hypothetical protein [Muribaculum sp.]